MKIATNPFHCIYYHLSQRGRGAATHNTEVQALIPAVVLVIAGLSRFMLARTRFCNIGTVSQSTLPGRSAQTGTGFSSMAVGDLGVPSKLVLILSIFIGGGSRLLLPVASSFCVCCYVVQHCAITPSFRPGSPAITRRRRPAASHAGNSVVYGYHHCVVVVLLCCTGS